MTGLRTVRTWLMIAATGLLLPGACFGSAPSNDVRVLLFQTQRVQQVRVRAAGVRVRTCSTCAVRSMPLDLDLRFVKGRMRDAAGRAVPGFWFDGEADVSADDGRHATVAGHWTVQGDSSGIRLQVVVPRERYVAAVLSAEAAKNEPPESLRALAIVARSFAAGTAARHEGGALCDTTHCQALRFGPVPSAVHEAVEATSGETLWFGRRQAAAYFSQNCGGFTANAASAWGGQRLPWLSAHRDPWCVREPAAWRASLRIAEVQQALTAEGLLPGSSLAEIAVAGHDDGGRVQQVRLSADGKSRLVSAATLRFALNRSLGWNQLRSDRYQVRMAGGRYVFEGSGFGHGVGLCQAGAATMARAGKQYREILSTYFPGTEVRVGNSDHGWRTERRAGYTLRTVAQDVALAGDTDRAFAEAKLRWGAASPAGIVVTVFASTEDFRQATGQPGWDAAVTQGLRILVQQAAMLRGRAEAQAVLRHEFLHAFVEAKAVPGAPLWLREGLVEALDGEPCVMAAADRPEAVEQALRAPGSEPVSRNAHRAACAIVTTLVRERGKESAIALLGHPATR